MLVKHNQCGNDDFHRASFDGLAIAAFDQSFAVQVKRRFFVSPDFGVGKTDFCYTCFIII